ncbi:hypothetical protein IAR50_000825 [Cryptococcus sp. DSM 104548]
MATLESRFEVFEGLSLPSLAPIPAGHLPLARHTRDGPAEGDGEETPRDPDMETIIRFGFRLARKLVLKVESLLWTRLGAAEVSLEPSTCHVLTLPKRGWKRVCEFVPRKQIGHREAHAERHACGILHNFVSPSKLTKHSDGAPRILDFEKAVYVAEGERAGRQADFERERHAVRGMVGEEDAGQGGTE